MGGETGATLDQICELLAAYPIWSSAKRYLVPAPCGLWFLIDIGFSEVFRWLLLCHAPKTLLPINSCFYIVIAYSTNTYDDTIHAKWMPRFSICAQKGRLYPREHERASYGSEEMGPGGRTSTKEPVPGEAARMGYPRRRPGYVLENKPVRSSCCVRNGRRGGGDSLGFPTVEISDGAQNSAPDQLHFLRLPKALRARCTLWTSSSGYGMGNLCLRWRGCPPP